MKYKIAVCDDEENQIEYMSSLVRNWARSTDKDISIRTFSSAEEFLFWYEEERDYDILLLDIEMRQTSGIELAGKIREEDDRMQIVFVTGYPDYMAEGYEVAALHYLLKPVSGEKMSKVLDRAAANMVKRERMILLRTEGVSQRIPADNIFYAEVLSHKVTFYTRDRKYETKLSISEAEEMLGGGFVRCHRSYVAGMRHVVCVTRNSVAFEDGRTIPLARSAYHLMNRAFIEECGGGLCQKGQGYPE